jgi:hypothetical protein
MAAPARHQRGQVHGGADHARQRVARQRPRAADDPHHEPGVLACPVCQEISYAVASSAASKTVTEWRALAQATRHANVPGDWVTKGGGSSVGRPLVYFQSGWLDADEDSYVQVEIGNNYDLPTASVMIVALAPTPAGKIVFPDRLWRGLVVGVTVAPALPEGITDASVRGRGARGQAGVDAQRNSVPAAWSRGFNQPGWHSRGRTILWVPKTYATRRYSWTTPPARSRRWTRS